MIFLKNPIYLIDISLTLFCEQNAVFFNSFVNYSILIQMKERIL